MKNNKKKEMLDLYVKRCDISQKLYNFDLLSSENEITSKEYVKLYEEYKNLTSELGMKCSNSLKCSNSSKYKETYERLKKELEDNSKNSESSKN